MRCNQILISVILFCMPLVLLMLIEGKSCVFAQTSNYSLDLTMTDLGNGGVDTVSFSDSFQFGSTTAGYTLAPNSVACATCFSPGAEARLTGSAFIQGQNFGLGFVVDVDDNQDETRTDVVFRWTSTDKWSLVANTPTAVLPNLGLNGNFVGELTATTQGPDTLVGGNPLSFEAFAGFNIGNFSLSNSFITDGVSVDPNFDFGIGWSNPGQTSGDISLEFKSNFFFGGSNRVEVDGTNTFTLESIKFEDGTTPEEHGFTIAFDSGRISPNLIPGDFDLDSDVDGADFLKWQRENGTNAGLNSWKENYGMGTPQATAATVPEPSACLMLLIGTAFGAGRGQTLFSVFR